MSDSEPPDSGAGQAPRRAGKEPSLAESAESAIGGVFAAFERTVLEFGDRPSDRPEPAEHIDDQVASRARPATAGRWSVTSPCRGS